MLAAGFAELAAQLGARRRMRGTRWRGARGAGRRPGAGGCWCSTTRRTGRRSRRSCRRPGRAGADHQPEPDLAARPGPGRAGAGPGGGGGVPGRPDRRPGPAGGRGAGRGAGRAAAGAGAGRRLHPGQRETAWPGTWRCSGSGGRTCWPAARPPGTPGRWPPPGRWRVDGWSSPRPAAAGLLRLLAFCAPEAVPLRLLLQPRPGLAGQLSPEVAPVLVPLLEDELAAGDAVAALRRYSLVTPGRGRAGVGAPAGAGRHRRPDARTSCARQWRQAAAALIEAALPADPQLAGSLAGVRGAAAARPGGLAT